MTINRPIQGGRPGRRWGRFGLMALALVAFGLEGCSSFNMRNGCGSGKCGGLFANCKLKDKLFHRRGSAIMASDSCDPALGVSTFDGMDGQIMAPGPVLAAPPVDSDPNILPNTDPLPPVGSGSGTSGTNSGAVKSAYQSQDLRARGEPREARRDAAKPVAKPDPLDGLPALLVPGDSREEVSPPVAPSAGDPPSAGVAPPAEETFVGAAAATSGVAPGIRRFRAVESQFAAGSLPNETGWKFLADKGYKTVLDLRETSEIRQGELAEISHYGFRYISLPTSKITVDPARVKSFEEAIATLNDRPIFVFDDDGVRPASLAFLHLILISKTDRRLAEREIEDLGASDSPLWQATLTYLASQPVPTTVIDVETLPVAMIPAIPAPMPSSQDSSASFLSSLVTTFQIGVKTLASRSEVVPAMQAVPLASGD